MTKKTECICQPQLRLPTVYPRKTEAIYRLLRQSLPGPVNYYDITIYADGKSIEDLIPNYLRKKQDKSRLWQRTDYKGDPWVKIFPAPLLPAKDWKADTSPFGKATENIIKGQGMLGMATSPPVLYHRRLVHPIIRHTLYYTHAGKCGSHSLYPS